MKGVLGVNSAMTPLGMVLSAPLIPRLLRVVSPWRAMVTASVAIAVVSPLLAVVPLWAARNRVPRMVSSGPVPVRSLVTRLSVLLVAVWGGVAFAGYPLVLAILGEGLEGSGLLLGNTAFAVVWGLGGIAGPPYSGVAIDWLGPAGMPLSLATLWLLALAVIAVAGLRGRRTVGARR